MIVDGNQIRFSDLVNKMIQTPFRRPWDFRIEITGQPADFDIFVKDITYGPTEIKTDEVESNALTFTYPSGVGPVGISMTVRDHEDRRVSKFFSGLAAKIVNGDGTFNLPKDYLVEFKRFSLLDDGEREEETDVWEVLLTQVGDVTESREQGGVFLAFPVSMMQFSNMGYKFMNQGGVTQ